MKKLALTVLYCCWLGSLVAAYQYGDYVRVNEDSLSVINSGSLTLNFISNISVWDTMIVQVTDAAGGVRSNTMAIAGQTVDIGTYLQGDSLKFFLSGQPGTTINSHFWASGWDSAARDYEYLHFGGNYGQWGQFYTSSIFQLEGSSAPFGQPLPGLIPTLLLSGVGISLTFIRKKTAA